MSCYLSPSASVELIYVILAYFHVTPRFRRDISKPKINLDCFVTVVACAHSRYSGLSEIIIYISVLFLSLYRV
jgi:hypothetical protein